MAWRSSNNLPEKQDCADLLSLALLALLLRGGEHVALLGRDSRPSAGRGTLTRLAFALSDEGRQGEAPQELPVVQPLPRNAQVVMIGDFLSPLEEIHAVVEGFAARDIKGHLLQILDPAEETLPYSGRVRFESLEGEEPWLLSRVETVRAAYQDRLQAQREGLAAIAGGLGWTFAQHRTDSPPQSALLSLYMLLSQSWEL